MDIKWVRFIRTWHAANRRCSALSCPTRTHLKNPLKNCGFATYAQSFWLAKLRLLETLAFELSRLLPSCSLRICLTTAVALNACWKVGRRTRRWRGGGEQITSADWKTLLRWLALAYPEIMNTAELPRRSQDALKRKFLSSFSDVHKFI